MATAKHSTAKKAAPPPTPVAYLFGAGATQAELSNYSPDKMSDANYLAKYSLLLASVSKRVCNDAKRDKDFTRQIHRLLSTAGLSNIELFVSLLEENQVDTAADIVDKLKSRIQKDILVRLKHRQEHFYLHKALFEFHKKKQARETLIGIISLNYDRIIDEAYELVHRKKPNYCLSSPTARDDGIPLLKLHGGFDLEYRNKKLPIITPAVRKNYLRLPYNFIWGRALELLMDCEVLRVVGCSLSQNDLGLIDLLFKAHMSRKTPPIVQLINFDPVNNPVKENLGFFPRLQPATEIEGHLITDVNIRNELASVNPFKIWLRAKIERMMESAEIKKTTYVRKVLE